MTPRPLVAALIGWMVLAGAPPAAEAQAMAIDVDDLPSVRASSLPLGILRSVADQYASDGLPVSCPDLRQCSLLSLWGSPVDLDGDGANEWLVKDQGFSGSGAELDYVYQKKNGRWQRIGRFEDLFLSRIGPTRTHGFLDFEGDLDGKCAGGRGRALWNGRVYVVHKSLQGHRC